MSAPSGAGPGLHPGLSPKDDNAAVVLSAVNVTSSHLPSSHLVIYSVSAGLYEIHGDDGPGHGLC